MKKIIIADIKTQEIGGNVYGHYVPVAKNYLEIFNEIADIKAAAGPIFSKYFEQYKLIKLPYNNSSDKFSEKIKTFCNSIALFWKGIGKTIILQQSTTATSFVAIALFYWGTGKLFLIQYNTEGVSSKLKRFLYSLAKYKIDGFIVPNERVGNAYDRPYCVVTDYIKTNACNRIIPYAERKWDFGIIGTIFKDKGVIEAIEYLAPTGCKMIVAGNIAEPELEEPIENLKKKYPNVEFRIGYIDDDTFHNLIRNSRYCVLNYRGTYFDRSSGVVLDIIFNHTPVVGTRCNALKMVENENMGCVYDDISELDIEELLSESNHNKYLSAIDDYFIKQEEFKNNLIKFVGL